MDDIFPFQGSFVIFTRFVLGFTFQINRHLLILDWHGSHVTLKVVTQAQTLELDMVILPVHASHVLQPLDVNYSEYFKIVFKNEKDNNMVRSNY